MRWKGIGLLVAMVFATPVARADDASHLALARDLVAAMHSADQMRQALPAMTKQVRPVLFAQAGGDDKSIDDFLARYNSGAEVQISEITDKIAQVYAQNFSDADLKAIATFYKSPAGIDFIAKQSTITQAAQAIGLQWGQGYVRDAVAQYKKERGVN
ncbi:DUF2059 domain-containing protein [Methylovirgula sp. 4M-Z18]|uniref:DUF2059 domain-containing protein n=1 Tax=Methylovirgula sp. 4M-Z18 TaxID=2293567 RepID=UPI000E2F5A68|nr:DUF2059 domain-containing protein [Methylovirgula sp. 4M-Z18]RFB79445.1 DUF2059 domain-containing protein [Methylovirgula sp. 4M-Z18]